MISLFISRNQKGRFVDLQIRGRGLIQFALAWTLIVYGSEFRPGNTLNETQSWQTTGRDFHNAVMTTLRLENNLVASIIVDGDITIVKISPLF